MENLITPGIVTTIVAAVISGIAYIVKYILNKRDEAQKRVFEQRDKDKEEIKGNIATLQKDVKTLKRHVHNVSAMVLKCDNPDCPTKQKLAEYWDKEEDL